MLLEELVPSLDMCKNIAAPCNKDETALKLNNTAFVWAYQHNFSDGNIIEKVIIREDKIDAWHFICPAPTAEELIDIIPTKYYTDNDDLNIFKNNKISEHKYVLMCYSTGYWSRNSSLLYAVVEMFLELKQNGHV